MFISLLLPIYNKTIYIHYLSFCLQSHHDHIPVHIEDRVEKAAKPYESQFM